MTNLLVQSVDTIHFYHFLSTEHNCVQITPSQGNSHKILLSIKINAMFYFWENEEEIGKAVQEKKNLGRTLFFGQSFGYSDTVMMKQLFTDTWHLPVLLICFPPIPLNPNPSVLSSKSLLSVMPAVGHEQCANSRGGRNPEEEGNSQSSGVLREWSSEAEMTGRPPAWSAWLPLLWDFRGHVPKKPEYSPLGTWQLWAVSFSLPSWTLSACGRH